MDSTLARASSDGTVKLDAEIVQQLLERRLHLRELNMLGGEGEAGLYCDIEQRYQHGR
jgi:hypothetical protein